MAALIGGVLSTFMTGLFPQPVVHPRQLLRHPAASRPCSSACWPAWPPYGAPPRSIRRRPSWGRRERARGPRPHGRVRLRRLQGAPARRPLLRRRRRGAVVFLGPSGCGKTTFLSCLAGLLTRTSGSIRFRDTEVTNLSGRDARRLPALDRRGGVPGVQPHRLPHGPGQRDGAPAPGQGPTPRGGAPGPTSSGRGGADRAGRPPAREDVGRPAAAGGHRPGLVARPAAGGGRRADRPPRPPPGGGGAGADPQARRRRAGSSWSPPTTTASPRSPTGSSSSCPTSAGPTANPRR